MEKALSHDFLKASGSQSANAGIDVQRGNLEIQNSEVNIELTNGNIFGLAAGYGSGDNIYGGSVTIGDSLIRCTTSTDKLNAGERYNLNMYFYEMANSDQLHYYVKDGDSFIQKEFDEVFELGKYISDRYDTNYGSIVISSTPLAEYCSHEWNEGTVTKEAACEVPGEMTYTCALCGEEKTEEIAALGHAWDDWKELKEATCTEDGAQMRTCSRCNETETQTIDKLGHDYVETIIKEPTCTEDGLKNQECSRCHDTTENVVIPATGHDYEWVVTKEATFHEDGVRTGTCKNCKEVKTERIPKLSESHIHDYTGREEVIKEATCTEEGSKRIYCTEPKCGEYITEIIPMTEHTPGEWTTVKEATCSENGSEQRVCTVCSAVLETRVTDTIPHTYGDWTVTVEPTCTEAGVESAECTVCGETAVRGINPLGHDYAEWNVTKEATCTEAGEEMSECTRCGETSTSAIEAKGHSFGEWKIVKEATETEAGERQAVCTECGEVKSEVIPKLSETQPTVPNGNTGADNNTTNNGTSADKNSNVPATGDEMPVLLCIMALAVSVGAVVIAGKRRTSK